MKTKVSPGMVGAFVLGAVVLGVIALLSFGGVSFFSKPQRFAVFFNESVNGLILGSPVKLSGVRVGRVVSMNVQFDQPTKRSVVRVVCEFNRDIITNAAGREIDLSNRTELQKLIHNGLQAQLGVLGLATGLLYVELDFANPQASPAPPGPTDTEYATVPAIPSTISEFQSSVTEILTDIRGVDFVGLAKQLRSLMTTAQSQLQAADLPGLVRQWQQTGASVNALVTSPEITQALRNLDAATAHLNELLTGLGKQIDPTSRQLAATLAQTQKAFAAFNQTAETMQRFIAAQRNLGSDATQTLERLSAAAEAVRHLADFLERNPQAILSGRQPPP